MSSIRLIFVTVAAFASTAGALSYLCYVDDARQAPVSILLVAGELDEQRDLLLEGASAAASDHGVNLQVESLTEAFGARARFSTLKDLSACDGVVFAADCDESLAVVDQIAATVKTVTVGRRAPASKRLCHVEAGAYHLGRMLAQTAREALPEGGKIALVLGAERDSDQSNCLAAFKMVFDHAALIAAPGTAAPTYEFIECEVSPGDRITGIRDALASARDAQCVVDFTGGSATELVESVRELGPGTVRLITLDQSGAALAAIEAGAVYAAIGHDPFAYGYHAVARLASMCRCGALELPVPGRGGVNVPPVCVRRENVAEFRARLQPQKVSPTA